jgi:hypothetical protein
MQIDPRVFTRLVVVNKSLIPIKVKQIVYYKRPSTNEKWERINAAPTNTDKYPISIPPEHDFPFTSHTAMSQYQLDLFEKDDLIKAEIILNDNTTFEAFYKLHQGFQDLKSIS